MNESSSIKKNAILLFLISVFAKGFAFLREILLAYYFGAGLLIDAYNAGITLSNSLLFLFSGGAFIPLLISFILDTQNVKDKKRLNGFFLFLISLSLLIVLVTYIFAPYLISSVNEAIRSDVVSVVRITAFATFFYALSSIIRAILNSYSEYKFSGAQDLVMTIVLVIGIFLAKDGRSLEVLSYTLLFASMFRVIIQVPSLVRASKNWVWDIELKIRSIFDYSRSFFPMILATLIPQIMIVSTRIVSSHLGEGVISGLSYADRTSDLVKSLVAYSLGAVIVAPLSKSLKNGDSDKFMKVLNKSLVYSFAVSIPLFFVFLFWGSDIVQLLYQRGSFTSDATAITGEALSYYAFATLFSSPIFVVMSAMYSSQNWKGVMLTTGIAVLVGTSFMFMTYQEWGIMAVALSLGVYSIITFVMLYSIVVRNHGIKYSLDLLQPILKLVAINFLSFTPAFFLYENNILYMALIPVIYIILSAISKEMVFVNTYKSSIKILKRFLPNQ